MSKAEICILETTLRDGNYLVDFQFTAADTAWMCHALEACGLRFIEIGHGLGLGASQVHTPAAASDEEYIKAARGALSDAKFGMFAIPGIANLDHIAMAADLGMDFIRIGANVDRVGEMRPFVDEARRRGMFVCTNFMKSYCLSPEEFGAVGALAEDYGSQMNYVVDSAGGMLPKDVRAYFNALSAKTRIPMGFHGHDNIRLAIANSLIAIECGARYVDTTLFGIGRGSGNAATELMAAILKDRFGVAGELREIDLIHLAETQAVPLLRHRRQETISVSLGLAQVHSMYLDAIANHAVSHSLDIHTLIREVGRVDRLQCDDAVLSAAADRAASCVRLYEDGLLELPSNGDPAKMVRAAENVAAKLGVTCRLWLLSIEGNDEIEVQRLDDSVDVYVHGRPWSALAAAGTTIHGSPVTKIYVSSELRPDISRIRAKAGILPVVVAPIPFGIPKGEAGRQARA